MVGQAGSLFSFFLPFIPLSVPVHGLEWRPAIRLLERASGWWVVGSRWAMRGGEAVCNAGAISPGPGGVDGCLWVAGCSRPTGIFSPPTQRVKISMCKK